MHRKMKGVVSLVTLLLIYHLLTVFKVYNPYVLPPLKDIFFSLIELIQDRSIFFNVAISLKRVFLGFSISFLLASSITILEYMNKKISSYYDWFLQFMRNIPPLSLIPLLILWFGIGEAPKLLIIILASFFPMYLNFQKGLSSCDKKLIEVGLVFKFSKKKIFFKIILPNAIPDILVGLRLGLGYSYRAIIGAELIAASQGLGYMINFAKSMARIDIVIVGVVIIGLLGYLCDYIFKRLTIYDRDKRFN